MNRFETKCYFEGELCDEGTRFSIFVNGLEDGEYLVSVEPFRPWNPKKNDALNAMLRDIARWRIKAYDVPNKVFEQCVEDFKRSEIWPKNSDPEPDYMTGEILYRPVSRRKLSPLQQDGIMAWLVHYMTENEIPSHDPRIEPAS